MHKSNWTPLGGALQLHELTRKRVQSSSTSEEGVVHERLNKQDVMVLVNIVRIYIKQ